MNRTLPLIIFAILFSLGCKGQAGESATAGEFYSKEFKWKLAVPAGFVKQTTSQFASMQKTGTKMLERGLDAKLIDYPTEQICSYKYQTVNYFEVNKHMFNKALYGDFLTSVKSVEDAFYTGFRNQVPGRFKIDTIKSTETIDGLVFQNFKLRVSADNKVVASMDFYSRLFGSQIFSVVIVYADKTSGDTMLAAWRGSMFEKN
jgi:hypothetical protein